MLNDGAKAPIEDRRGTLPPSNECYAEVIRLYINSYNPAISHYKSKNAPCKQYLNLELLIRKCTKLVRKQEKKIAIKHTVMFLNLKILVFHDLHKTSMKFSSARKTTSKILITIRSMCRMHSLRQTQSKVHLSSY